MEDTETIENILMDILAKLDEKDDVHEQKQDVWTFSYPNTGSRGAIAVGSTILDFDAGTVMDAAESVTSMSSSLRKRGKPFMQSLAINVSADSTLRFDGEDKITLEAGKWYAVSEMEFTRIRVTVATVATMVVIASTSPHAHETQTDHQPVAFAYESITVAATAIGGTAATYLDAVAAEISLETDDVRFRVDGTAPTAAEGHLIESGDIVILESPNDIAGFRAIRTGAISGVLKVTYFH